MSDKHFAWISAEPDAKEYITIDKMLRIYMSSDARKLLGVEPPFRLIVGYDYVNKRIVVAKPDVVRAANVKPFKFDTRSYAHARHFVKQIELTPSELPVRFDYVGKDYAEYPDGSYCFQLAGYDAHDDGFPPIVAE
jgi:hypothetical protein